MAVTEALLREWDSFRLRRFRRLVESGRANAPGRSAWVEHRRRALLVSLSQPHSPSRYLLGGVVLVAAAAGVSMSMAVDRLAAVLVAVGLLALGVEGTWRRAVHGASGTVVWWEDRALACWQSAVALERLERLGFVVLHDRAIPGTETRCDHVVIGPTGVWIVRSERCTGSVAEVDGELWFRAAESPHRPIERLGIDEAGAAGRDAVGSLSDALVSEGLDGAQVVLAVWDAAMRQEGLITNGVAIVPGDRMAGLIAGSDVRLRDDAIVRIARIAAERCPEVLMGAALDLPIEDTDPRSACA